MLKIIQIVTQYFTCTGVRCSYGIPEFGSKIFDWAIKLMMNCKFFITFYFLESEEWYGLSFLNTFQTLKVKFVSFIRRLSAIVSMPTFRIVKHLNVIKDICSGFIPVFIASTSDFFFFQVAKKSFSNRIKAAGINESSSIQNDYDDLHNDYNTSWQMRFIFDLQCLQKSMNHMNEALQQKNFAIVDAALRNAVLHSSSLSSTFEYITSDLMHLRNVIKNATVTATSSTDG